MGGCYRLISLGDRLQDGDLWVRTVFGGVLGTDTWGVVNRGGTGDVWLWWVHLPQGRSFDSSRMVLQHCPERTGHW